MLSGSQETGDPSASGPPASGAAPATGAVPEAVAAGSAALGRTLSGPVKLAGSDRSVVLRCRDSGGGTVVVKRYPGDEDGPASFAAEAAGLAVTGGGLAPELLAADPASLTVVMSDLGSGPSVADVLLGDSAPDASRALLDWAGACGRLSAGAAGRLADFDTVKSRYLAGRPDEAYGAWLRERVLTAGEQAARLAARPDSGLACLRVPDGLTAELRTVAGTVDAARFPIFSPGDICPDNNLITSRGIRFLDFESAAVYSAFLDAAYIRMPFATCWCVYRLPPALAAAVESAYREQVAGVHPELADDGIWAAGLTCAVAAWTLSSMYWLLPRALAGDGEMHPERKSPRFRQLIRYRWQVLAAELDRAGGLPALAQLADSLLAATGAWAADELPLYPAFG
jgi:hypothetical protein